MKFLHLFLTVLLVANSSPAQNLLSNSSMESGGSFPTAWTNSGAGYWATNSRTGTRSVALTPARNSLPHWDSASSLTAGKPYVFRFWSRTTNAVSGYCIGGFNTVNRDFPKPVDYWDEFSMAAWMPNIAGSYFRMGFWDMDGTIFFDDAEVLPLNAVHKQVGAYALGDGETLDAGRYTFQSKYSGYAGNYSRALHQANVPFNTSRWSMGTNSQVVYRHELGGQSFSNAQVKCGIQNYFSLGGTVLRVEVSTNGTGWEFAGSMLATVTNGSLAVPANLLPATEVFIRISTTNIANLGYGLSNYCFSADVPDTNTTSVGETHYFGQFMTNSPVRIVAVDSTPAGKLVTLSVPNGATNEQTFQITAITTYTGNTRQRSISTQVAAGTTNQMAILLPTAGFGNNTCIITVQGDGATNIFQQNVSLKVNILTDDSYGARLPSPTNTPVWWCESDYKVGRSRYLPIATSTAALVHAARNEYEPFQIVLRPEVSLSNVTVSISDFISVSNPPVAISATNVTVCRVEYVNVTQLINGENFSTTGEHPDPLVPVTAPFDAPAQTNCPLWFTVHIPKDAPAGEYQADVMISSTAGTFTVPVRLRVFGFALTDVTHSRTAHGAVLQHPWHGLLNGATLAQERAVWELYMENMARHRSSPYFPQWYHEVQWGYNAGNQSFSPSYTEFDPAMERYLEEYNFTSFKDINFWRELPPIPGVPSITGSTINPAYRPLYKKLMQPVMQHLRERGWMDRAYSYWLDEPQFSQYPLFREGMRMVEETAPDLKRLGALFYGPGSDLFGNVNLWVQQLHNLDVNAAHSRQALGEEVWYWVAAGPTAPWPNNFIDHPGINARARTWIGENLGLEGEAYYGINYYLGTSNPWIDPMSSTGTNTLPVFNWGNGDGTLVYPPVKEKPTTPLIAAPFDSVRWELMREGVEDREYFWELARILAIQEPLLGTNHPVVAEGRAAKAAAMAVVALPAPEVYPYEASKIHTARLRTAAAIEALQTGAPFVAKHPLSKVVTVGAAQTLRIEAAGWPAPSIQWQHAGTNLVGETASRLTLTNIITGMAGAYTAIISNSVGTATSSAGYLTVLVTNQPPVIIKSPDSLTRTNGARAVFGVGASSLTPVTYQWLHNGAPIAGATDVTLLLTNLNITHAGSYTVLASNSYGGIASLPALLSMQFTNGSIAPLITGQPTNMTVSAGQTAQFSVSASGTAPLNFQWYFNGTNLPSATASLLSLTNAQPSNAGSYHVTVGNVGGSVTSIVATLTVQTITPFITSQPTNQTVTTGQSVQFAVVAGGSTPLAYQWYLNDTNLLTGANTGILTLTNVQFAQAGSYLVQITNIAGAVTSSPALLQFAGLPSYTNEPPGLTALLQASEFVLMLAPDNRPRTVLVSTNLLDWETFYSAAPSATIEFIPASTNTASVRFFRLMISP